MFADLSKRRSRDEHGPLPISLSELLAYCTFYGINDIEQRTTIDKHIQALDEVYLDKVVKKGKDDKAVDS